MTFSPDSTWGRIRADIERDIAELGVPRGEFVVSRMTRSVANAIEHATRHFDLPEAPALDIGTGTGYHSLMLLALGHPRVCSVDLHPEAIVFAKDRLRRFLPDIPQHAASNPAEFLRAANGEAAINLYPHGLDQIAEFKDEQYSIASFNPPILYPFHDVAFDKPATQGVYFTTDNVKDPKQDLVYQFYDRIARNNIPVGGHILCVWPSLLRHLVELEPFGEGQPEFVHPCAILEKWFGFQFDNEPESFEDFHQFTTVLAAGFFNQENVGELYERNLRYGIEHQLYSELLIPADGPTLAGTHFNFGVLHLVRTDADQLRFRVVNGSARD